MTRTKFIRFCKVAKPLRLMIAMIFAAFASMLPAQADGDPPSPLSTNDVSILFPVPNTSADLDSKINMANLVTAGTQERIWTDARFQAFLDVSENSSTVSGTSRKISYLEELKSIDKWVIAGIRIDPGAPGVAPDIVAQFGRDPQIRLITQPLTVNDVTGDVRVHDITAHLIFSFSSRTTPAADGCHPRFVPNDEAFSTVVKDISGLKTRLQNGDFGDVSVVTDGKPLSVHPGLTGGSAVSFSTALKSFLESHLSAANLTSMAVMALPGGAPEPWIFLAMQNVGPQTIPLPNPVLDGKKRAQMLSFLDQKRVIPTPSNNNKNPITCRHATLQNPPLPISGRSGVSTADVFDHGASGASAEAILNRIADSGQSHFFNTDCVSCHTESSQAKLLNPDLSFPDLDPQMLPKESWNVRNFGWFPSFFRGTVEPTITRRTASETSEAVAFINKHFLEE